MIPGRFGMPWIVRADGRPFATYMRDTSSQVAIEERLAPGQSLRYWTKGRDILVGSTIVFQGKAIGSVYLLAETSDVARRTGRFWTHLSRHAPHLLCACISCDVRNPTSGDRIHSLSWPRPRRS